MSSWFSFPLNHFSVVLQCFMTNLVTLFLVGEYIAPFRAEYLASLDCGVYLMRVDLIITFMDLHIHFFSSSFGLFILYSYLNFPCFTAGIILKVYIQNQAHKKSLVGLIRISLKRFVYYNVFWENSYLFKKSFLDFKLQILYFVLLWGYNNVVTKR